MAVELSIGGEAVRLEPAAEAVERVVLCAYSLGGFCLVMTLQKQLAEWKGQKQNELEGVFLARQSIRGYQQHLTNLDAALKPSSENIERIKSDLRDADRISELMRQSWADVAEAEEAVLAVYESAAVKEFVALIDEAKEIAEAEWIRYAPYDSGDPKKETKNIASAKDIDLSKLCLKNEWPELLDGILQLREAADKYRKAQEMAYRYQDINFTRRHKTQNPYDVLKGAEDIALLNLKQFEELRAGIGEKYPIALQVYGRIGNTWEWNKSMLDERRKSEIEIWVIRALAEVYANAPQMRSEAEALAVFKPDLTLRQFPDDPKGELASYLFGEGRTPRDLGVLPSELEEAKKLAREYGYVIPASYAVAHRLLEGNMALKSAWMQLPVRHKLTERALGRLSAAGVSVEKDPVLAPYFEPGRLHYAALEEVYDAVQDIRAAVKKDRDRLMLMMDAIAFTMAFFTAGKSLLFAGAVHAVVRGAEMHSEIEKFMAARELSGLSFAVVEECIWRPPSTLKLAGELLECGFDIAGDVAAGKIGSVLNAIQVVIAIGYGFEAIDSLAASKKPY